MNLLLDLNEQQAHAVRHEDGPILVMAGPGTGKTRVITYRIAHLIRQRDIPPERILAITFTNKAAQEMRTRVESLLGATGLNVWIQTFHTACTQILRQHGDADKLNKHFVIFDEEIQEEILAECAQELGIDPKAFPLWMIRHQISYSKARLDSTPQPPADRAEDAESQETLRQIAELYQQKLGNYDALDFDDLIGRTIQLLKNSPETRTHYHQRVRYLLVDEYQDINHAQYELLMQLVNPERNVMVVADADQSIYSWRGSDPAFIERFRADFDPEVVQLGTHYRSTQNILRTAQSLIMQNRPEEGHVLDTRNERGTAIYHYRVDDADEEAQTVARLIRRLVDERRYSYGDIAIFYRTHRLADKLEDTLLHEQIGMQRVQPSNSFHRERVREVVAFLRYLRWQLDRDLTQILNYPRQRLAQLTLIRLQSLARQQNRSLMDVIRSLDVAEAGPLSRLRLAEFLDRLGLLLIPRDSESQSQTMEIVRQLLDFLDEERGAFVGPPEARRVRGLRLAADSLYRATQLGETIYLTVQPDLQSVVAAHVLHHVLHAYLNVQAETHWLQPDEAIDDPLPLGTHVLIGDFPELETDIPLIRISHEAVQIEEHIVLQDDNLAFVALRLAQSVLHYFETSHFDGCTVCAFRMMGTRPESADIVEIAATKLDAAGRSLQVYQTRIRPRSGLPKGWDPSQARNAPSIEQVLPDFVRFLDGQIVVGHGISGLPMQVLERELRSHLNRGLGLLVLDTYPMAQRLYPRENCSLEALAGKLRIRRETTDDPLETAAVSQKIFLHLVRNDQEQQQLVTLEEMLPWVVLAADDSEAAYEQPAVRYCKQHGFDLDPILAKLSETDANTLRQRLDQFQGIGLESTPEDAAWQTLKSDFLNRVLNFDSSNPGKGLESFLDYQSLLTNSDEVNDRDKVTMMTLHSAKGTEYPVVLMIGMDEGNIPLYRSDEWLLEEERRLCYVGMTRAKERLYLFSARRREGDRARPPSMFIREIPKSYLRYWSSRDSS